MRVVDDSPATLAEFTAKADLTFHAEERSALTDGPLQASEQLLDLPVPEQESLSFTVEIEEA